LLILRFTPRALILLRLDTPFLENLSQDCLMKRFSLPRGNSSGASHAALDHAYRTKEGQTVNVNSSTL